MLQSQVNLLPSKDRFVVLRRAKKYYDDIKNKVITRHRLNMDRRDLEEEINKYHDEVDPSIDVYETMMEILSMKLAISMMRFGRRAVDESLERELMRGIEFDQKNHPKIYGTEEYNYYPPIRVSEMVYVSKSRFFLEAFDRDRFDELKNVIKSLIGPVNRVNKILRSIVKAEDMHVRGRRFWVRNMKMIPNLGGLLNAPGARNVERRDVIVSNLPRFRGTIYYKLKILFYMKSDVLSLAPRIYTKRYMDENNNIVEETVIPTYAETTFVKQQKQLVSYIKKEIENWKKRYAAIQLNSVVEYQMNFFVLYIPKEVEPEIRGKYSQDAIKITHNKCFLRDSRSRKNCLYASVLQCLNCCKGEFFYPQRFNKPAKYLIKRVDGIRTVLKAKGITGTKLTQEWVESIAKHFAKKISVYGFNFKRIHYANGKKLLDRDSNKTKYKHVKHCKIWAHHGHAYAMIPKKTVRKHNKELYDMMEEEHRDLMDGKTDCKLYNLPKGLIVPERKESVPICPAGICVVDGELRNADEVMMRFKKKQPELCNLVAYDLETLLDKDCDNPYVMKCYAMGLAFMRPKLSIFQKMRQYLSKVQGAMMRDDYCCDDKPREFYLKSKNYGRTIYMVTVTFFHKTEAIKKAFDFVDEFKYFFIGSVWFAHNGGKFDFPVMMREFFFKQSKFYISEYGCLSVNNRYINVVVNLEGDRRFKMTFKDSCAFMPGTLARLGNEVCKRFKKITGEIDHEKITIENCLTYPKIVDYLEFDCLTLFELVATYNERIKELSDGLVCVLGSFTAAHLAKSIFLNCYYSRATSIDNLLYLYADDIDLFVRASYYGGRVECFKLGTFEIGSCPYKSIQYMDFTSHYPAVGRFDLPVGKPKWVEFRGQTQCPPEFYGFLEIWVRTMDFSKKPLFAIHDDKVGLMICPHFKEWRKIKVFSEEMKYAQVLGIYAMRCIRGVEFKRGRPLERCFNEVFQMKAEYKKNGQAAMAFAAKVTINSIYGFWGMRVKNRPCLMIMLRKSPKWRNVLMVMMNEERLLILILWVIMW